MGSNMQAEAARKAELLKKRREAAKAKREAIKKLREQATQESDDAKEDALIEMLTAEEVELEKIENTIRLTEKQKAAFDAQFTNEHEKLNQIRADFEKNNADFTINMEAEAARKSEMLKKRREAAKAKRDAAKKIREEAAQETDPVKKEA